MLNAIDCRSEKSEPEFVYLASRIREIFFWLLHLMSNLKWNVSVRLHEHDILDDLAQLHLCSAIAANRNGTQRKEIRNE